MENLKYATALSEMNQDSLHDQHAINSKMQRKYEFPLNKTQCSFQAWCSLCSDDEIYLPCILKSYHFLVSIFLLEQWPRNGFILFPCINLFLANLLYSADISVIGKILV